MNQDNLEYLKKQLFFAGFGEGLVTQLEKRIKEGQTEFQISASHEFGKDKMEATLYFTRSKQEGSDMYFFNKYDATLQNHNGTASQTFFINNKGKSVGLDEACNLLCGRSVYKEITPKEGDAYKAWIKLDFSNRDENGQAKVNYFNNSYGYDLHEAVGRIPLKELGDPDRMEALYVALQRGQLAHATLIKGGKEISVQLAADPKFKTVKMFDMDNVKLYVPGPKQDVRYGQAPVDQTAKQKEVGQSLGSPTRESSEKGKSVGTSDAKKKEVTANNSVSDELLPKKRAGKSKGLTA
ncbi:hypothetical protein [Sediminibacterium ginsengisoli]|uniref:DUF3945 domain-containing protein n=1 Tax=Sediminibacterium ginsengisoli TaxID=413434 RepID=A0A1T4NWS5_9BACT|nr:hypothetical protein [Sediminibacterium ginsengisoli]SJZ83673.1 hypothetical protein SAMN04488132_10527 [Sediminibacterium ginsengisoli]